MTARPSGTRTGRKYDNGAQAHWLIRPAEEGWPLFPAYHALRLLLQTTDHGWQVLGVDPWADRDWNRELQDEPEHEVAAYAGPNGELALIGMDTAGRALNASSTETSAYSMGGLPATRRSTSPSGTPMPAARTCSAEP